MSLCLILDNQIACGCSDGTIKIWDLVSRTKIKSFKAHEKWISCLLLVDKTKLISCSWD
jgi:WD40 repeat protein